MSRRPNFVTLVRVLLVAMALTLASSVGLSALAAPQAGAAEVDDESAFVARINELRIGLGLAPLSIDTELVTESRSWANQLRSNGVLSHADDLSIGVSSDWAKLGENVGVANTDQFDELFEAFVNSPLHYANLIDPDFTHVGTGVVYSENGRLWTTHRFMAKVEPSVATTTTQPKTTTSELATTTTSPKDTQLTVTTNADSSTTAATGSPSSTPATTTTTVGASTTSTVPTATQDSDSTLDVPAAIAKGSPHPQLAQIPTEPLDRRVLANIFAGLAS